MTDELDIYEALLRRSLERGVPSEAVADIFELPLTTVKDLAKQCTIKEFGTTDQGEYLEKLQMKALGRLDTILDTGSADQVARIVTQVFGRQIQAAGRRPSSDDEDRRKALMEAFQGVREAPRVGAQVGRFVVGNTNVDRRARRDEEEDE